ncbi:hypothetical protein BDZ45DRAFT_747657 [Acephala macrosclerotiorum]|nr:hypothetical protein BDZ45DRAFT_747657 [Acephala macrosclerotiorum]
MDIDIDMSAMTICDSDPEEGFRFFKKLPIELRYHIWDYTFEARSVHMYLDEIEKDGNLLDLECIFASDKALPAALSVCKESRELALRRYQKIETDMPFENEEDLDFSYDQLEIYHRTRTVGQRRTRVNFDLDTVLITGINLYPVWSWWLPTHSIKNLALDLTDADDASMIVEPDWEEIARRFPNLKNLNLVFGVGCCIPDKRNQELSRVKFPLITMDSNLEDFFHHRRQLTPRCMRLRPSLDVSLYIYICSRRVTIMENLRSFLTEDLNGLWGGMKFETTFLTWLPSCEDPLGVQVGHMVTIENLGQLPRKLRHRHKDSTFPRDLWISWKIGDGVEDLYSRYDGLQLLFGEVSPPFSLDMAKASQSS